MGRPTRKNTRGCWRTLAILAFVLAIGTVLGYRLYIRVLIRQMSPEIFGQVDRFFEEPIDLPEDWRVVVPYSEELLQAREALVAELRDWTGKEPCLDQSAVFQKLVEATPPSQEEWQSVAVGLKEAATLLGAVTHAVECRDYELQVWPEDRPNTAARTPQEARAALNNTLLLQATARLLIVRGLYFGQEGKWDQAFDSNLTALRLVRRHPAGSMLSNLMGTACQWMAVYHQTGMHRRCDDPDLLRRVLREMNALDASLNHRGEESLFVREIIGGLRYHIRNGRAVDLTTKRPAAHFQNLMLKYGNPWSPSSQPTGWGANLGRWLLGGDPILVARVFQTNNEGGIRERTSSADYDLARLFLANRIRELEGDGKATKVEELVPAFFQRVLESPFTGQPYLWDATREVFYGVGPNGTDEGNSHLYSPTNGTVSQGDLSVR